jgi:hypothetical protein
MSNTATLAPSAANLRQVAPPMPPAPPVTMTVLFFIFCMLLSMVVKVVMLDTNIIKLNNVLCQCIDVYYVNHKCLHKQFQAQ